LRNLWISTLISNWHTTGLSWTNRVTRLNPHSGLLWYRSARPLRSGAKWCTGMAVAGDGPPVRRPVANGNVIASFGSFPGMICIPMIPPIGGWTRYGAKSGAKSGANGE
jgi:hypothetical protein